MSQFDVHRTKGGQRSIIPYVVIVQSHRFDHFHRRFVVPLVDKSANPPVEAALNPVFIIENRAVVLHTLQSLSIPSHLGETVCSLADDGDRIIAALDLLISRAWG
ncbi:plasmid maintenance protein CcdB [Azospirillum cavernae]|uniref:Toxin CcdB n=1 Tax=Azospirillum cavernae TaxID=2320860 RepID=A0A418VVZ0_9PROT|nr:CcdB family protein [Azospirillum cavernae]RJF81304.1 plasmid maintenance protein CcdB [Azospirillum cavernae]